MTFRMVFLVAFLQFVCLTACAPYSIRNGTVSWCYNEYYLDPATPSDQYRAISGAISAAKAGIYPNQSYSYSEFTGIPAQKMHGLVQCREDLSLDLCMNCLQSFNRSVTVLPYCKTGGMRNDFCLLRFDTKDYFDYDNTDFLASAFSGGQGPLKLTKDHLKTLLTEMIETTMNGSRTVAGIANYADNTSATGRANVYGLVMCINQMLAEDCHRCLDSSLDELLSKYNNSAAVSLLRPSCFLRYSCERFFSTSELLVINVSLEQHGNSSSHGHGLALKIGLGSAGAAVLVAVVGICVFVLRKRKQSQISEGGNFSYKALVDATANFSTLNELGSGGCGTVYKGLLKNKVPVAVKKLKRSKFKELVAEVSLVSELHHENILKLLGYCFHGNDTFLIYDYMANQTLDKYFKDKLNPKQLNWSTWYNIVRGIARGLQYLHFECGKDIIHRDLKPSNILLDSAFSAKIADFDLAKVYNREHTHETTEKGGGTMGYFAPELYHHGKFSTKSDVYSYGVVVLEILTGFSVTKFNINGSTDLIEHVWSLVKSNKAVDVLDFGHLGITNPEELKEAMQCMKVALLCIESEPSKRPETGKLSSLLSPETPLKEPSNPGYPRSAGHTFASPFTSSSSP